MTYLVCGVCTQVGWSALLASVHKEHEEITLRLTEAGANPHLQNLVTHTHTHTHTCTCVHAQTHTKPCCSPLQEYRSALRLAIEYKQEKVVDAFLDTHPDVKPGLCGPPELDSTDKVYIYWNI